MMRTTGDLNQKFKDLGDMDDPTKVTCATCHRRSRHPEIEPPAARQAGCEITRYPAFSSGLNFEIKSHYSNQIAWLDGALPAP